MKKEINGQNLISYIDSIFMVDGEMVPENGEDSYMFSVNEAYGIVGVFDGCGGLGSRKYAEFGNKSGAYISSRVVSNTTLEWFGKFTEQEIEFSQNTVNGICDELKDGIVDELKSYEKNTRASGIKGSMTKSFPTTLSVILFAVKNAELNSLYIWAGDSRGFILNASGLAQITRDDIETSGDAFDNISDDGVLTNVVSAGGEFVLRSNIINCKTKGVLITATDGCFGYFSTPMEFEYMLVRTMVEAASIEEWQEKIREYIKGYTADDYTLGIVVFGYKSFKKMKKEYSKRCKLLFEKYIKKLEGAGEKEKKSLWDEYKNNYYRSV